MPAITKTHAGHTNFFPPLNRRLLEGERRVLEKCRYACYASDWAAEAALNYYGKALEAKIKVIPFGANIEVKRQKPDIEEMIVRRDPQGCCNLLFAGRSWESKGGPIALAVAHELRRRGRNVRLDVLGCNLPGAVPDFARVHGFVSKKTEQGAALIDRLYRESHFLIVPTRFEAYGLVYVEASSYGVPSLATAIGGVTTIVRNGRNGQTFDFNAAASEYADHLEKVMLDPTAYRALCRTSFAEYEQRLNWKSFGERVRELVCGDGINE